jgi:hypothetical protein
VGPFAASITAVQAAILSSDEATGALHFAGSTCAWAVDANQSAATAIPAIANHFLVVIDCPAARQPDQNTGAESLHNNL